MNWEYESICLIEIENKESLLFKPLEIGHSIMKSYAMWIFISELEFELSISRRTQFLAEYYLINSKNLVLDILNLEISNEDQEVLIYFYYLNAEEIKRLYELMSKSECKVRELYEEVKYDYHNKKELLLKEIAVKNYLEKLVNVRFSESTALIPYISLVDKKEMNLQYIESKGAIITLGYEYLLAPVQTYDHTKTLNKFKALGDETRLNILELILENYMSASEISNELGLTLPTIAHHLKVLSSAGIIVSFIEKEKSSKISYKIHNPGLDELIGNIKLLYSGGRK